MQKIFFYLFLITFGTFISAVLSFKNVEALVKPFGVILYGTLFVWIIEILLSKQIKSWRTVYLYGVLFGFIIEAFSYKSFFFGLSRDAMIFFDIAIIQAPFLIFVAHPLISIMAPVYIMKSFFKVPFALPSMVSPIVPFIGLALYTFFFAGFFNISNSILPRYWWSVVIVIVFLVLMRLFGKTQSLGLPNWLQKTVGLLAVLVYIFTYFTRPVIGGREIMFPNFFTLMASFAFLWLLFFLVRKRTPTNKLIVKEFNPDFSLPKTITALLVIAFMGSIAVVAPIHSIIMKVDGYIMAVLAIFGIFSFFLAMVGTIIYSRRSIQKEMK